MGEVQVRVVNLDGRLQVSTRGGLVDVEAESHGYFSSAPQKIYERWAEFVTWYTGNRDRISPAPGGGIDPGRIGAPTPSPRQVFAVGLNYADHAAESGVERPESPVIFTKFASAITGPVTTVPLPSDTVDWEVELVVVIGRGGRTSQMIFPVPALIEHLSHILELYPGDVLFTGTPAGVGVGRTPQRFLGPGDVLRSRITEIGELVQTFTSSESVALV